MSRKGFFSKTLLTALVFLLLSIYFVVVYPQGTFIETREKFCGDAGVCSLP